VNLDGLGKFVVRDKSTTGEDVVSFHVSANLKALTRDSGGSVAYNRWRIYSSNIVPSIPGVT
jgi:hypothetical protein